MTKFTEHLRRRILAIPAKCYVILLTLCCLSLTLFALFSTLNIVYVSDSHGASRMLITRVEDPEELMDLSGIVAEEEDSVYFTAFNGNLASLSIQRAVPITVHADGEEHVTKLARWPKHWPPVASSWASTTTPSPACTPSSARTNPSRCTGWNTRTP